MSQKLKSRDSSDQRGKLRIGNDWNAITIIALSQSNPLKAIAELVENSIDAHATNVTIVRGRSEGRHYLEVRDNGQGIPRDADGRPDFRYVATHICDRTIVHGKWSCEKVTRATQSKSSVRFLWSPELNCE